MSVTKKKNHTNYEHDLYMLSKIITGFIMSLESIEKQFPVGRILFD